jgi:hypothetical protein
MMDAELKMHHFNHEYDDLQRQARTSVKCQVKEHDLKKLTNLHLDNSISGPPEEEEMRHFS